MQLLSCGSSLLSLHAWEVHNHIPLQTPDQDVIKLIGHHFLSSTSFDSPGVCVKYVSS